MALPIIDKFPYPGSRPIPEMPDLSMAADEEDCPYPGKPGQNPVSPGPGTNGRRRKVVAAAVVSRKAECHGQYRNSTAIVECAPVDAHPIAQPVAGCIVKEDTACMHLGTGRLSGHEQPRSWLAPENWPGLVGGGGFGEPPAADPAFPDHGFEVLQALSQSPASTFDATVRAGGSIPSRCRAPDSAPCPQLNSPTAIGLNHRGSARRECPRTLSHNQSLQHRTVHRFREIHSSVHLDASADVFCWVFSPAPFEPGDTLPRVIGPDCKSQGI